MEIFGGTPSGFTSRGAGLAKGLLAAPRLSGIIVSARGQLDDRVIFCARECQCQRSKPVFRNRCRVAVCAAGGMLLEAGEIPMAAVFGLVFAGVGLAFILPGMRNMLKPPAGPKQG